ncbi:GGDEF domain-containing protein [Vulgatibacter incomptus]|uniref:diguanylate cyclase n=1 Tax=Vulgatibacter incomptus TaxID=1391653 RepID=A0A0K1P7Z9_9BACT|nr:GGDEF domain-containing protein [Vulgatibacter incomptus]AKU89637.1 FHA domain/GGDEF domain protein [Vulgatibacter incomptus]
MFDDDHETTVIRVPGQAEQQETGAGGAGCLVVIYGQGLGRLIPLDGHVLGIGRDPANRVVVEQESVSRRHCEIRVRDGQAFLQDLGSTNGTYLNDSEIHPPREELLRSGDLLKVGGTIFKYLGAGSVEASYHEEIYRMAIVDGLTEVNNRRYLLEFLDREMARCNRHDRPLSLLVFDLDHFKQINDTHGHLAGDAVLRELSLSVKRLMRKEELLARFGGDEFVVVLPESTAEQARAFSQRLLTLVGSLRIVFEKREIPVSISIGIASMSPRFTEPALFIEEADANLLAAKRYGRGRAIG